MCEKFLLKRHFITSCVFCFLLIVHQSEKHFMLSSHSCVIIPFPPHERKDQNNLAEMYGSPGASLLCHSKWKTRALLAERDTGTSTVSRPHGARAMDTDTAHYLVRPRRRQRRSEILQLFDSKEFEVLWTSGLLGKKHLINWVRLCCVTAFTI